MRDYDRDRATMLELDLAGRDITDPRVLAAMGTVPREHFVPATIATLAYADRAVPIAAGQTVSQPYIVAYMCQAARIAPGDRVLEIGTGSGYAAAVLSLLAAEVVSIERHRALADAARDRLRALGFAVDVRFGDGTEGVPERAPFDAILVTAAAPGVPAPLREQLAVGGRLVLPLEGRGGAEYLQRVTRVSPDTWREERLRDVDFVPLIGRYAHPDVRRDHATGPT